MKKWFFACVFVTLSLQVHAKPYLSEFRFGGYIIHFHGTIDEETEPLIRTLQTKYLENLNSYTKRINYQHELESLGVYVEMTRDDPTIPSEKAIPHFPPYPQSHPYDTKNESRP